MLMHHLDVMIKNLSSLYQMEYSFYIQLMFTVNPSFDSYELVLFIWRDCQLNHCFMELFRQMIFIGNFLGNLILNWNCMRNIYILSYCTQYVIITTTCMHSLSLLPLFTCYDRNRHFLFFRHARGCVPAPNSIVMINKYWCYRRIANFN